MAIMLGSAVVRLVYVPSQSLEGDSIMILLMSIVLGVTVSVAIYNVRLASKRTIAAWTKGYNRGYIDALCKMPVHDGWLVSDLNQTLSGYPLAMTRHMKKAKLSGGDQQDIIASERARLRKRSFEIHAIQAKLGTALDDIDAMDIASTEQ